MLRNLQYRRLHQILILVVILLAAWFRLWRLPQAPPGFYWDEAYNAMDAVWMIDTGTPKIFFEGNNGREPMYMYLAALFTSVFGATPYAVRLGSALVGILTVALMYRWLLALFAQSSERRWIGLIGAAGLAFSFWHLIVSRAAWRTVLVPTFVILTAYLFWRGWFYRSLRYFVMAGIALGLSQYTFLSARVIPLIYLIFVVAWVALGQRQAGIHSIEAADGNAPSQKRSRPTQTWFDNLTKKSSFFYRLSRQQVVWAGIVVTAVVAFVVWLPLGLFFINNPGTFFMRAGQVNGVSRVIQGKVGLIEHLSQALPVFVNGYGPNWRLDLVGRSAFTWLSIIGLWAGLIVAIKRIRQPIYLFLLVSLFVLWLPGLLSAYPSIHSLRLAGMVPIYYTLMSVGLITLARLINQKLLRRHSRLDCRLIIFMLVVLVNGGTTAYDYFIQWANKPIVHVWYDGPQIDLANRLIAQSYKTDILLPQRLYDHPVIRFSLYRHFLETSMPSTYVSERSAILVDSIPEMALESDSLAYVWLTRDKAGKGVAYISRQQWPVNLTLEPTGEVIPFTNPVTGETVATLTPIKSVKPVIHLFTNWPPLNSLDYSWAQSFQLAGYHATPNPIQPGQTLDLNLYWNILKSDQFWDYDALVDIVNNRGDVVSQSKFSTKEMFRWRQGDTVAASRRFIYISPELVPGPYIIRLSILEKDNRVPIDAQKKTPNRDQAILGLFYVITEDADPLNPPVQLETQLGKQIKLLGYAPPQPLNERLFRGKLYWQADDHLNSDYISFVQLFDPQNQLVANWESQPLAGQYPTSFWRPGEVVVDEFDLQLPYELSSGQYRLVTGMYDPETGIHLPAFDAEGQQQSDDMITLTQVTIP